MRRLLLALIVAGAVSAVGCASSGRTEYACAGYPSRPLCLPPSQVYRLTEGSGPPPATARRPSTLDAPVASAGTRDGHLGWGAGRTTSGEKL